MNWKGSWVIKMIWLLSALFQLRNSLPNCLIGLETCFEEERCES